MIKSFLAGGHRQEKRTPVSVPWEGCFRMWIASSQVWDVFKLAGILSWLSSFNVLYTDNDSCFAVKTSVDQTYFDWWNKEPTVMSLPSHTELFVYTMSCIYLEWLLLICQTVQSQAQYPNTFLHCRRLDELLWCLQQRMETWKRWNCW